MAIGMINQRGENYFMKSYLQMNHEELLVEKAKLEKEYKKIKEYGLDLNLTRGKPSPEQLDISMDMYDLIHSNTELFSDDGIDCRNYGGMDGIVEAKKLMAGFMDCKPEQVIMYGNASLSIMYDIIARSMTHGVLGATPWCKLDQVKFLCPVPGYDRHFSITEYFGIEMINVPMKSDGPDMDIVETLVQDVNVKGIWCVPKYSNPQGITYSDETVCRFAALKPAAKDFRIFWDNAYAVHDLYENNRDKLLPIMNECEKMGNLDMVYQFCSTSKVTFSGAGISAMAASDANRNAIRAQMSIQTIGHDKIKQWLHAKYLKDMDTVRTHMAKHAALVRPKFEAVEKILAEEIIPLEIGTWINPNGGYFICFEALEGCAKSIIAKAKEAGVALTAAGAPFPYGKDPKDSVIRIAPTFPSIDEMKQAAKVFVCCVKLASVEKLLG